MYGTDPLSRYQATLSGPTGTRPSSRSVSGYDAFGNPLRGQYVSGDYINALAQDRLFAQLTGATAQQLLGPGAPGARPNTTFLRPEQMEALLGMQSRLGGSSSGASMSAALGAPGVSGMPSPPDPSGLAIPQSFDPKLALYIGAGALLLLLLFRR